MHCDKQIQPILRKVKNISFGIQKKNSHIHIAQYC